MSAAVRLVYGKPASPRTLSTLEEEVQKSVGASVMVGERVIMFDNVAQAGSVRSQTLEALATSGTMSYRVLGESNVISLPIVSTVLLTGNHMELSRDLARRTIDISISPGSANPTGRRFAFDPEFLATNGRTKYLGALLTVVRAYALTGRHRKVPRPIASFESWSWVADLCEWLGMPRPMSVLDCTEYKARTAQEARDRRAQRVARGQDTTHERNLVALVKMLERLTLKPDGVRKAKPVPVILSRDSEHVSFRLRDVHFKLTEGANAETPIDPDSLTADYIDWFEAAYYDTQDMIIDTRQRDNEPQPFVLACLYQVLKRHAEQPAWHEDFRPEDGDDAMEYGAEIVLEGKRNISLALRERPKQTPDEPPMREPGADEDEA
jgi:hypothetical protein